MARTKHDIISTYKADGLFAGNEVPSLLLRFEKKPPDWGPRVNLAEIRSFWKREANEIVDILWSHIPGALLDHIFAELARRKASDFRVPHSK